MTEDRLLEELRMADPAPVGSTRPEGVWSSAVVLQAIQRRSGTMQTIEQENKTRIREVKSRRRLLVAGAAAAVMAAITVVAVVALGNPQEPDVAAGTATARFTGDACVYEGPAEFALNERVTFTFVNASSGLGPWGFEVWAVPEGTTAADINERGIFDVVLANGGDFSGSIGGDSSIGPGVESSITRTLRIPGQHAIVCVEHPGREAQYAAMFRVSGN